MVLFSLSLFSSRPIHALLPHSFDRFLPPFLLYLSLSLHVFQLLLCSKLSSLPIIPLVLIENQDDSGGRLFLPVDRSVYWIAWNRQGGTTLSASKNHLRLRFTTSRSRER